MVNIVVKQIVEGHQGHIEAYSAGPGQGIAFTLTSPIINEPQPLPESRDAVRVLLIDDNKELIEVMGTIMQMQGYEVYLRYSGPEGIAATETLRPDVSVKIADSYHLILTDNIVH